MKSTLAGFAKLFTAGAIAAATLVPARSHAAVTESFCSFPITTATWTLNQNAFFAQNVIRLTDNIASETGSAFYSTAVPLTATTPFHAYFRFQISPNATGGDGIAFVMQNAATGAASLGSGVAGMGYLTITPSISIKFDTYKDAGDPSANFAAIVYQTATACTTTCTGALTCGGGGTAGRCGLTVDTAANVPTFVMANGGNLSAWVDYTPGSMNVYLAQTATKPGTPILTSNAFNLFNDLGAQMFVGFTSATGLSTSAPPETNQHDVYELEFSTAGAPCSCEGDSACSSTTATPACLATGICGVCSATNSTACTSPTTVCDVPTDTCVGCLNNSECADPNPICDATSLACRACASAADCSGSTPQCATSGVNSGDCVVCIADKNCGGTTPRCTTTNTCVQCLTGADCGGDTPVCTANVCKPCTTDANCSATPSTPACQASGACGQCSPTNATQCAAPLGICDFPSGTCVGCEFDSDCAGTTPVCDTTNHMCAPCLTNADCDGNQGGPACVTTGSKAGSCVICEVDKDCTSPAAPKCDTVANLCVQCLSSTDCSAPDPVCNTQMNICVGCLSNADCSGGTPLCNTTTSTCAACQNDYAASNPGPLSCPTSALPACQPAGSTLAGQCAVCSTLNNSVCVTEPLTPVCIASQPICGCIADTNCAADNYCDTTTVTTGNCTPGCRVVNGTDNCATGEYCTKTDGTVGTCMTEPCNSNTDCKTPTAVCDTIPTPHVCVQCLNDPDCPTGKVCNSTNLCVQCTSMQTQNCKMTGTGSACLASGICGCATDADCGGATSGRICNTTNNTCEAGCRGSGGNGCPAGETCSSTTNTAGVCEGASTASSSSSSTSTSSGAGGGDGGTSGPAAQLTIQSAGCGCGVASSDDPGRIAGLLGIAAAIAIARRRDRRAGRAPGRRA